MFEVFVPDMEDQGQEVYLVDWFKEVGEQVTEGEPLAEVMTDKANMEISVPCNGILRERRFDIDDRIAPGQVLAVIEQQ